MSVQQLHALFNVSSTSPLMLLSLPTLHTAVEYICEKYKIDDDDDIRYFRPTCRLISKTV